MEVEIPCSSSGDIGEMSTLLVATIEETKERLHQLELLFCSRLFPSFQSRSRALSDALSDCRTRESSLLRRIDELRDEKRRDVEEEAGRGERVAAELRVALAAKAAEAAERKEMTERLLRQLDDKEMELAAERSKRRHLQELFRVARIKYRKIKSNNRYLVRKLGLPPAVDDDDDDDVDLNSPSPAAEHNTNSKKTCFKNNAEAVTPPSASKIEQRNEILPQEMANKKDHKLSHNPIMPSRCGSSPTSSSSTSKYPGGKPSKTVGVKRSNSSWRDTRANQEQRGFDPHDDFLDTPMEIARGNTKKDRVEAQDISVHAPSDMATNSSDDETQDVNAQPVLRKEPVSIQRSGEKTFKYVEPVRKKAERENLKGVECEQCKKFYDAVHPDINKNGSGGIRCEHHEGVSRHRYRHVPPMTPEGFWNIGFDSDM